MPTDFESWANSYHGKGQGEVVLEAFPEPYLGSLAARPAGVFLALNPGRANLDFQGRRGVFAEEIGELGSYSAWAATWPYLRHPWIAAKGRNRHHASRLSFLRRWHHDPSLDAMSMVGFELFPWHSKSVTAAMRPDRGLVRQWVWEPVAELHAPVFAFGAPWFNVLEKSLGLKPVLRLGLEGRDYGSSVPSRAVAVYRDEDAGVTVVAERHAGSAGPPNRVETDLLHEALHGWV